MNRWGVVVAGLVLSIGATACGSGGSTTAAASAPVPTTPGVTAGTVPIETTTSIPHFATPEAAMQYLAAAWNANDLVSLRHVTTPAVRDQLAAMHAGATNLRLDHCEARQGLGDYVCYFHHDYPIGTPTTLAGGVAIFLVGPADGPGWYMTVFQSCN